MGLNRGTSSVQSVKSASSKDGESKIMTDKTEKNLAYAFAAESKASVRNATFARKAEMESYHQIARLFRAVSDAESVHARRYLLLMRGKIGSTEENLEAAFQNEIKANVEEYPKLIKTAAAEGNKGVLKAFTQARDVESLHAELYKKALNDMVSDRETDYYVCQVCGYIGEDHAPDKCPICGAIEEKFKLIS
jgi:rubrerythrin